MATKCPVCGAPLDKGNCGYCGYVEKKEPEVLPYRNPIQQPIQPQIIINTQTISSKCAIPLISKKSKSIALLLCIFFGYVGAHYFYVGKAGKGLLYLLTVGLFGIGWIIDIFRIAAGTFSDGSGLPLEK